MITSLPGIADVEPFGTGPLRLVVEVPHGADRRAHYDAVRDRLQSDLPADLHAFFHINTDVGAWQLGREVARVVAERTGVTALVIRCLIPRTFIDCNRVEEAAAEAGLTAGLAPWIRDEADRALLIDAYRRYVALVAEALGALNDGYVLLPHTYGPRTMNIAAVDDDIVARLREQVVPATWDNLPLRPEVDLITRWPDGRGAGPAGMETALVEGYRAIGVEAVVAKTYQMHAITLAATWDAMCPGRVLCMEVRRDLLVEAWSPFQEMVVSDAAVERLAGPLVEGFLGVLTGSPLQNAAGDPR